MTTPLGPDGDRREAMVREQLAARDVRDERLLAAFRRVPREALAPEVPLEEIYADHPSPIGHGQTISQPYMVALMLQPLHLAGTERVLEIGTGSGYQAALLAELSAEVFTVERIPELADAARARLAALGYSNIRFRTGDGTMGWPEEAPYDAIVVSAGARGIPPPLIAQLADGGRLIIPVGEAGYQELALIERKGADYSRKDLGGCRFVKLIGQEGWREEEGKVKTEN